VNLYTSGKYNNMIRRIKRGYTRGDVSAKQLASYYGELENLATNSKQDKERIPL